MASVPAGIVTTCGKPYFANKYLYAAELEHDTGRCSASGTYDRGIFADYYRRNCGNSTVNPLFHKTKNQTEMIQKILLDLMPDPEFYETKSFWIWVVALVVAAGGLIAWSIRKRRNNQKP
ncbi:MAG: hypothetical protein ABIX01_17475 [Chitinophagaceae bacterium]